MIINDQGHIVWWNQVCEKASGYTLEEVSSVPFWELLIKQDRKEELREKFFTWLAHEKSFEHENEWIAKSGEERYVRWINETVTLQDGETKVICSFGTDVSIEVENRKKLHEKEQALDSSLSGFALSDLKGKLTYANPAFLTMWGYTMDEVLGSSTLMFWEDKTRAIEVFKTLKNAHRWQGELMGQRKDGSTFAVELITFAVYSPQKDVIGFGGSFIDISIRKELEQAQRKNEEVLRTLLNSIPESAFLMQPDGTIVVANSTLAKRFNFASEKELEGVKIAAILPREVFERRVQYLRQAMQQKMPVVFEDERFGRFIRNIYTPILDEDGEVQLFSMLALDITDDVLKDKALRESEQRYRTLAEASQDIIFVVNKDGKVQYINSQAEKALRLKAEEVVGKSLQELFPPELTSKLEQDVREVFQNKKPIYTERLLVFPDGAAWLSTWLSPLRDEQGEVTAVLGVSRDFTDKQLAQENYSNLFVSLQDGIVLTTLDGTFVDANPAYLDMVGYSLEELKGRTYTQITPQRWHEMEKRIVEEQVFQRGFSDEYEKEYIHKNGTVFPIALRAWLRKDFTGKPIGMWAIVRDITEQRRASEELEKNRARLQAIFDNASVGLMVVDKNGRYVEVNERTVELLGYTVEEIRQKTNLDITYPEDIPNSIQYLNRLVQGEIDHYQLEKRYVRKDGSTFWALLAVTAIRKSDGEFQAAIGVVVDISERKAYEMALRESEDRFRRLAENARDLIYRYRFVPDQGFEYVSPSAMEITGYTPEEHYADPLLGVKIVHPEDLPLLEEVRKDPAKYAHPIILRWKRKDGSIIWTEQQNVPIYDSEQRLIAVEGMARDITDRKRAEMELLEARRQLAQQVKELERYSHELSLANAMLARLQACEKLDEAYGVIEEYAKELFLYLHGQLWILDEDEGCLFVKACFGLAVCVTQRLHVEDCLALQQKSTYLVKNIHEAPLCAHLESPKERLSGYLCVPIVVDDRLIGLFHFALEKDIPASDEHWELAETTAKQIGLALTNISLHNRLRQQAIHDNLTGLYNRLYMEEILKHELLRAMRTGHPISMMMLDIDRFKNFNDTYGHLAGDEVLRTLANTLMKFIRASDIASRYGGEEFLLILPEVNLETAAVRAEELRQKISELVIDFRGEKLGKLTISIGVAAFPDHGEDGEAVIHAADMALYQAKQNGRNRVVVAPLPQPKAG